MSFDPYADLLSTAIIEGKGPLECSTSVAVERWPSIVWDPNGYYRELGVLPQATRRELREAYQALGGQHSQRLTYIMHQLLDPEVRAAYDATPSGSMFLDDYLAEELRRRSAREISHRRGQALARGDIMSEEPLEVVDWDDVIGQTDGLPPEQGPGEHHASKPTWGYSYLRIDDARMDSDLARRWQYELVVALGPSRGATNLIVGLHGGVAPDTYVLTVDEAPPLVIALLRCDADEDHLVTLAERAVAQTRYWEMK